MRSILVVLLMAGFTVTAPVRAKADDKSAEAAAMAEHLTIVDLTDSVPYKELEPGELVRIVAGTPSGGKISIDIDGPGRLVWAVEVKTVKNGKQLIGEYQKAFVIRHAVIGQGPVKATVITTPPAGGEAKTTTYEFDWK